MVSPSALLIKTATGFEMFQPVALFYDMPNLLCLKLHFPSLVYLYTRRSGKVFQTSSETKFPLSGWKELVSHQHLTYFKSLVILWIIVEFSINTLRVFKNRCGNFEDLGVELQMTEVWPWHLKSELSLIHSDFLYGKV